MKNKLNRTHIRKFNESGILVVYFYKDGKLMATMEAVNDEMVKGSIAVWEGMS